MATPGIDYGFVTEDDAAPAHGDIAALAYSLWLERGSPQGSPQEDWFHAERILHAGEE